ncbi:hypothetical protein AAZX31_12G212100 [Glycine max]|uniref:RING-type E3 ubiquitin transferase n=1 Tax=Glycine max TaxID=3847 RepID=I1LV03_SOYBN|nr:uncharacterized protein LOC102660202 [Glycine max]KAG4981446.1 hypothetical protein JHK85_035404 [Glycine max]KAG5141253.1 hypothetical protein JHK84_035021 [Glycine max]KAH1144422.1 hypothetical protein GYH30_034587 [Glycine max]KAH1222816.1 hypothetical protein GmHk_12G035885 [Glycine max]KRH27238.1 hypothetical protein GLYMA_12G224000v4 [Glycine max]|eukprot:XP_006593300.1 uncharacterized protein LOC102660202 [Glycine max]
MVMNFLLSILFSLFTFFSFNPVSSFASQPSYKDHCASTVPDSTPTTKLSLKHFPLGDHHTGSYTGGDSIIDVGASWNRFSFYLSKRNTRATQTPNLFKLEGTVSFRSTNTFNDGGGSYYGGQRRYRKGYVTFKLEGFWHASSGKACMVGIGSGYSKKGNSLNVNAVFKLNNVFNASNITSLVSGSLESLSPQKDENYFEPISVLMFPKGNYSYTLDSIEVANEFSHGSDAEQGLALNLNSLSFCKPPLSWGIRRLQLEYSLDCRSSKNCTSISGSFGKLPSLMSLTSTGCSLTTEKHRLRVQVEFSDIGSYWINQSFDPKAMLVGEGWWDEKNNMLCVVVCHVMGNSSSLSGTHVGDCSIRLRLRFPSIWSIKNTISIVGQIWSNKRPNDSGHFKMVTFRNDEESGVGGHGLKYEYSQLEKVNKSCPKHKPNDKGKRYPEAYSDDMRFDMSIRESNKRVAWGYSAPLAVDDEFYESGMYASSYSFSSFSTEVPDGTLNINDNNGSLFNMSYKISLSVISYSKIGDNTSVFNLSSERVKISAEGVYDAGAGTLCMVGCRDLLSNTNTEIPIAHSVDCEILLKFQFPSLDTYDGGYIKGSIESTRHESDPLYFKRLDISAVAYYREAARRNVWRMDVEVMMALISTTLSCVFVGLQLNKVKKEPNLLPFISLIMMSILTLGFMIPLVLNFEALLTQNPNNTMRVFRNNGWLEVNEISVRLITMVAFLLQFRLLYLTWSARKSGESKKGLWIAERNSAYVTSLLYAAGLLIAWLLKLKNGDNKDSVYVPMYQPSPWENIKSYGGLVLDGFLLPQIILNLFLNMRDNVLSFSFYFGTTFVRLLPHAYDLYRTHSDAALDSRSYYYADPSEDFYSTAWDIAIPLGGILFAMIIYLQQRFGSHYILPHRFKGSKVYEKVPEKVPVVTESEAEVDTTKI